MTAVRSDNGTRIGVVVSAAALVVAVSLPLTAMADQSGTAGSSAAKTAADRGQQGLDRAREAGAQPQASESATGKDNKGGGPA